MSIFPYIYYMIESFHITNNESRIALFVGMTISAYALSEAISSCIWGRLSDRFGRKLILLCGLAGTGISMLVFGFSTNIYMALAARAIGGLLNGNIGVIQTTISELVKNEAHKSFGFALMPAIWCVGAAIGSVVGGGLADPVRSYPAIFRTGTIFDRFPYLLPNLVCFLVVVFAVTFGMLFLEETHEDLKQQRDRGLEAGKCIERIIRSLLWTSYGVSKIEETKETVTLLHQDDAPPDYKSTASSPELQPTTFGSQQSHPNLEDCPALPGPKRELFLSEAIRASRSATAAGSGLWRTLNTQLALSIVGLGILAYHTISAEQLLPVLFSMPESKTPATLPFWFTGGFALSTRSIGAILSIQGVLQIFSTMVIFPTVQLRFGSLMTFRMAILSYPLLYILVPYLTLVPISLRMPAVYIVIIWKVTAQAFAFPSINMMLSNAVPRRQSGTFNGVAQSSASLARAIGPTLSGLLEAAGLSKGVLGLPWWVNALIAVLGATLAMCMIEQGPVAFESEKEIDEEAADSIPPVISLDVDVALIAARSSTSLVDMAMPRPSSPLLTRLSVDIRRSMSSSQIAKN